MPVGWFWELSLILVGKSRRELTGTVHAYELWEDSLYVEFVDKYKVMQMMMMFYTSIYIFQCSSFCFTHAFAVPQMKDAGIVLVYLTQR